MTIRKRHIPLLVAALILLQTLLGTFSLAISGPSAGTIGARSFDKSTSAVPYGADVSPARGKFLVADRRIRSSLFSQAVILLVSYSADGAMGLVINRPTNVELSAVLPGIRGIKSGNKVHIGGPVGIDEMFLLIRSGSRPGESLQVFGDVYMSMSRKTLETIIGRKEKGENFRVYAGYAGWAPGQLEREIARGDWHVLNADAETVFEKKPDAIWPELIERASAQWVRLRGSGVCYL